MTELEKQLLWALKGLLRLHQSYSLNDTAEELIATRAAIAAAEAAQHDHIVDTDKMVQAVPDELNCDDIERLRIALSWEGYSTPEGLEQCAARWPELVRDLIRAVLSRKKRAKQPASAQTVAVLDEWEHVPQRVKDDIVTMLEYAADEALYSDYAAALRADYALHDGCKLVVSMLSAAQKPEGGV